MLSTCYNIHMRDVWTRCDLLPVLFRDRTFSFFFYAWWKLFWVVSFSCSASFHELELSPHLGHGAHHVGLCWVLLSTLFDNVHDVNMVSRGRWIHMRTSHKQNTQVKHTSKSAHTKRNAAQHYNTKKHNTEQQKKHNTEQQNTEQQNIHTKKQNRNRIVQKKCTTQHSTAQHNTIYHGQLVLHGVNITFNSRN